MAVSSVGKKELVIPMFNFQYVINQKGKHAHFVMQSDDMPVLTSQSLYPQK